MKKQRSPKKQPPKTNATDKAAVGSKVAKRSNVRSEANSQNSPPENRGSKSSPSGSKSPFSIVGIGASAGGLEAFTELLQNLPKDTGFGFVLVQHLDPQHESSLTEILSRASAMPVREVTNNLRVEANHVYVIPPNTNLAIAEGVLKLEPRPRTRSPTRSIDSFFESLAQDQGNRAIGVILSGTATDGTVGLEAIKAEGGITFAQDDSARYDSMPRSAVAAGCVDLVLSPEDIAKELGRISKHPYVAGQAHNFVSPEAERESATAQGDETPQPSKRLEPSRAGKEASLVDENSPRRAGDDHYKKILLSLRNHCGVDFSLYKPSTIQRRITRRMVLNKQDGPEDYARFLKGNAKELDALYSDCLISVTSFFRNPEAFDVLKRKVFPKLLQQRGDEPLRAWVLGCSTGQEAYSVAMTFLEAAENAPRARKLQIFATDLNDAMLDKARHGLYPKAVAQDISPERLRRFFVEEEGGYRIVKSLREMVVFARQNLISDPPFSRMDLITCRNLLIYLEPSLQRKAFPTFHYALKPQGFLFLGASESIGSFTELFEPVDKKQKIFSRKVGPTPSFHLPMRKERGEHPSPGQRPPLPIGKGQGEPPEGFRSELNAQREADRVTVNEFAPPGILINAELQILQFRGPTSAYLQPPSSGKATHDVLKMAREGLMLPLRAAINRAKKENKTSRAENVVVKENGKTFKVNVEVIPLKNLRERCFLILFEEAEKKDVRKEPEETKKRPTSSPSLSSAKDLERELSETRDFLQSVQEQYEAANEELQASNEEVQSANEELQSINEELETSKEELESANEELTTVNEEMGNRNTELNRLNADLNNLQTSTKLPILLIGRNLTIRRFSATAEKIFDLLATDVGRPVGGLRHNLVLPPKRAVSDSDLGRGESAAPLPLEPLVREVIDNVRECEKEVRDKEGRWYSLRVRPYMTLDNKVDGAVLVLVNIDENKRSEAKADAARDYAEATIRTARDPLVVLRSDMRVNSANEAFYKMFKTTPDQSEGRSIFELSGRAWDIPKLRTLLKDILPRNSFFNDFEVKNDFPHLGRRTMLLNARRMSQGEGALPMILLAIEDVTERLRADDATAALAAIVNFSEDAIISQDLSGVITSWNQGAERLFGYMAQESVGQQVNMLVPLERRHEETAIMTRLKRGEPVQHFETVRLRKDQSSLEVSLTISPIKDATGKVIGASKIARDITELKKAVARVRASEIRYRRLFEAAHDGVLILDSVTRKITDANPFITDLLGYTREDLLGRELWQIGLLKDEQASHSAFRALQQNGEFRHEYLSLQTKSGQNREVEVVANRYEEEGTNVIQCNIRDISERKEAEETARRSAALFSRLVDQSPNGMYVVDDQFRVQQVNSRALPVFAGVQPLIGRAFTEVIQILWGRELGLEIVDIFRRTLETGERYVSPDFTKSREDLHVEQSYEWETQRVTLPDGKHGVVCYFTDVTERKRAEEALRVSEEFNRSIIESSPDCIKVLDLEGNLLSMQSGQEMLGIQDIQPYLNKSWIEFWEGGDVRRAAAAAVAGAVAGRQSNFVGFFRTLAGEDKWWDVAVSPIRNARGTPERLLAVSRDVTERQHAEKALRGAQAKLADRAGQLEHAVIERTAELTVTNQQLEAFVYSIAHDLRAPLRAMQGCSAMLVDQAGASLSETGRDLANRIDRSAQFMDALLKDLLTFSRVSQERLELATVDLGPLVETVLSRLEKEIQEKNARVETSGPWPAVLGHDRTLEQVLFNLASNALKFGAPEVSPIVRLWAEEKPEFVRVWVEDNGIGIAPEYQEQIFRLFTRLHGEKYSGTGIGLTIVQKGVERMGGHVGVDSTPGEGSRFWFELRKA